MFTESLTVRILGDSSDLQRELEAVVSQLEGFESLLAETSSAGRDLADGLGDAGAATSSMREVSTMLSSVEQQSRQLSQQSISLNVQPALTALAQLSAAIQSTAAQLASLGSASGISAAGGVSAPGRMDNVATLGSLESAGAFAMTELFAAPASPVGSASRTNSAAASSASATTTNHFGGITVNVSEPGGVNEVIRDLRMHGAAMRTRRG